MRRVPVLPTVLVGLAMVAMVALGVWQLARRHEKLALLRQYAANRSLPPIALPAFAAGDDLLFRRASAYCLQPVSWQQSAGRDSAGRTGWREVAQCRTGAEGPGFAVQAGIAHGPDWRPDWKGGPVSGILTHAPDQRPILLSAFDRTPHPLMIVADTPAPGLAPNAEPDLASIPNNHLAYAVQWFVFASLAGIIYALALRRRWRLADAGQPR